MNPIARSAAALCLAAVPSLFAQPAANPPPPYPGFINAELRKENPALSPWDFGLNVRLRQEFKGEAGATDAGSNWDFSKRPQDDNQNEYQLLRVMPRVGYTTPDYSFLVETRTSESWGDERYNASAPGQGLPERDGPIDLYQGFLQVGNPKNNGFVLKIGRQELVYGDQRLVGHSRWGNNPRTFDAIKARWQAPAFALDLFTGGVVYVKNKALNHANDQDVFSGAYLTLSNVSKKETVETYVFARNVSRGIVTDNWSGYPAPGRMPAPQDLYTAGVRVKSKPKSYGAWDYTAEAMYQFGSRTAVFPGTTPAAALAAPRLDQQAYATVLQGGYTWAQAKGAPRLALIYSYASGDKNPADTKSQTFQNLFPSNHLLYGNMDLSSLQNLHDLRLTYSFKPFTSLTLTAEAHLQRLARTTDFWYNIAGVPRNFTGAPVGSGAGYRINPGYSRDLGTEFDLLGAWAVNRQTLIEVGASYFRRGDYIKQSLAAVGSHDAYYAYAQLTLTF